MIISKLGLNILDRCCAGWRYRLPQSSFFPSPAPSPRKQQRRPGDLTSEEEIKQFCTNIADPARDQRYLLQKQELEKLQADIDSRMAEMDKRKAEYQDWLKRRNDFLKQAEAGLTDIYKNMKPDAAALQLQEVQDRGGGRRHHAARSTSVEPHPQRDGPAEGGGHRQYHRQCVRSQYVEGSLMNKRFPAAIAAVALLAGCQSPQAVREIGRAPAMSPIGSGLAYGQTPQMALYPKQPRAGGAGLFAVERFAGRPVQGCARAQRRRYPDGRYPDQRQGDASTTKPIAAGRIRAG